ncbi:hypothetical protein PHYBLDRAFT_64827 [Phycomyces blakesleeanus NRRL 1555(-)]|uniref:DDE Tnp4 domain-containing protein n=1 Tax=Phycomyces blakesleeanus (strain ATCC 8743b / DSM 1359 / FGSC 10004 / NBRC 33097 / NRRL 1555) TaxID=763407 RepID=A0A162U6N7_PHYB8|nr:hypothetical protein PHYBLDRAFT_64827 [Phycomyces blakesleeanus NRRL 1555(-)]OAD73872.1 hypothetical protein PHYBLDRAFT_64827 [Phycomyces blakesleeanus NRRL 1555(-)]|eukprot:XP_018291912.1 hypothetical protein PHYBLDRAFT_64827 [Phycomyces blakesleeanus NRRL 1555(-)]
MEYLNCSKNKYFGDPFDRFLPKPRIPFDITLEPEKCFRYDYNYAFDDEFDTEVPEPDPHSPLPSLAQMTPFESFTSTNECQMKLLELITWAALPILPQSDWCVSTQAGMKFFGGHKNKYLNDGIGPKGFRTHYRVNQDLFDILVHELAENPSFKDAEENGTEIYPVWKQLAIVLWSVSNTFLGRSLAAERLNITPELHDLFTERFLTAINRTFIGYAIKWPTTLQEFQDEMKAFRQSTVGDGHKGLRECVGAIDCRVVVATKDHKESAHWKDRRGSVYIPLLAVCDKKGSFKIVKIGATGTQNDIDIFRSSAIYENMTQRPEQMFLDPRSYIIGGNNFPNLKHCLTPYPDKGTLTPKQISFNKAHRSAMYSVKEGFENAFKKWQYMFKRKYVFSQRTIGPIVTACCILNNLCQMFITPRETHEEMNQEYVINIHGDQTLMEWYTRINNEDGAALSFVNIGDGPNDAPFKAKTNRDEETSLIREGEIRRDQVIESITGTSLLATLIAKRY